MARRPESHIAVQNDEYGEPQLECRVAAATLTSRDEVRVARFAQALIKWQSFPP